MVDAFSLPDLRWKLLFTLAMLVVFRFVAHVPVPGVDRTALADLFQRNGQHQSNGDSWKSPPPPPPDPRFADLAKKLAHTIAAQQIDIVSLDPFVKSHAVEENNNSMIDHVVQILSDLAEKFEIAIDVPHHMAKGAPDPGNANRARGPVR